MNAPVKLPFGHPSTLREGPFPCKGDVDNMELPSSKLSPEQEAWMKQNKPAYYTGKALCDIPHLPPHLRFA